MTLALSLAQAALTRPNDPHDPTGIAHATDPADLGDGVATKAARVTAKLQWADYVDNYKSARQTGDSSGPPEFPYTGITYSDD